MKRPIGASNHEAEQSRDFYTLKQGDVIARPTSYLAEGLKDAYLEWISWTLLIISRSWKLMSELLRKGEFDTHKAALASGLQRYRVR